MNNKKKKKQIKINLLGSKFHMSKLEVNDLISNHAIAVRLKSVRFYTDDSELNERLKESVLSRKVVFLVLVNESKDLKEYKILGESHIHSVVHTTNIDTSDIDQWL